MKWQTPIYDEQNQKHLVVVGMSGGVDSSVAALLLKLQGYRVLGLFMKNWEEKDENGQCSSQADYEDVAKVCQQIGIPYHAVEFVDEYQQLVFKHFLTAYEKGHTPNPDILCNREIKFNLFYQKALELGASFLATGHYCQNQSSNLFKGADAGKDQSYFVYTLKKEILDHVLFPIGHLQKSQVREIAREYQLATSKKKDSTGICFIGERNFRKFISGYIKNSCGEFKMLDGTVVGQHVGFPFYTLGQRKGLGLGGAGEPWYVVDKDSSSDTVFVERGDDHPALYSDELWASDLSWVDPHFKLAQPLALNAKIRYRQQDQECLVSISKDESLVHVTFSVPQRAATIGQSIVFYQDQKCLGGGVIDQIGPSYFIQKKQLPKII